MTIKFSNLKDTSNKNTQCFHFVKFSSISLPHLGSKRSNTAVAVGWTAEWTPDFFPGLREAVITSQDEGSVNTLATCAV